MKIISTNWVNLTGVFAATFIFAVVQTLTDTNLSYNIFQAILASLLGVLGYGMIFWVSLMVSLIILDVILIVPNQKDLKAKLIAQWAITSSPFVYWTIEYHEWVFAVAVMAFLITQLLRERMIRKQLG